MKITIKYKSNPEIRQNLEPNEFTWFQKTPTWIGITGIPFVGGGGIAYAGYVVKNNTWIGIGISFIVLSAIASILPSSLKTTLFWAGYIAQILTGLMFKQEFLAYTYPRRLTLPEDDKLFKAVAKARPKIEINTCSKNELVNRLGISIVYANTLMNLREEGYGFTHAQELTKMVGMPLELVQKISPFITFSYYQEQEYPWKRINHLTTQNLIDLGIEIAVAKAIIRERKLNGEYKSIVDIKKRISIPFNSYKQLF